MARPRVARTSPAPKPEARKPIKVSPELVALSRVSSQAQDAMPNPFEVPANLHPPQVASKAQLAQDSAAVAPYSGWAAGAYQQGLFGEGLFFLGYPYLSELAQRPEYRKIVETIATEMTRRWIKLSGKGDDDKTDKIAAIEDEMDRLNIRDTFRRGAQGDGFFGRGHIFIDLGDQVSTDNGELATDIGDGRNGTSRNKVAKGSLKAVRAVEAVWCYPQGYNSTSPLDGSHYKPSEWLVMGTKVHASRLLSLVAREVPDLLKPSYSFGGLSLTQMAKPYVDNWLRARKSVSDLLNKFSTTVFATDMTDALNGGSGADFMSRLALFQNFRSNMGVMALDKDREAFENVSAPLGSLDRLQAQAQEQMASIASIPLVKLLGITPSGLNASSDGEVRCFYDWIHAQQEQLFAKPLDRIIGFVQLSLFGEVDPDITYTFEPLWNLNETEAAQVQLILAQTDAAHIEAGVITNQEARTRLANDVDAPYQGLDPDEMPEPTASEALGQEPPAPGQEEPPDGAEADNLIDPRGASDGLPFVYDAWEENKHPRAGNGEFGKGGGKAAKPSASAKSNVVKQHAKLTEQQRIDVKDYKEGGYKILNSYLRTGKSPDGWSASSLNAEAKRLDGAIAKSSLQKDTTLYRGLQHPALAANAEKLIGREVPVDSFQSTSTSQEEAERNYAGFGNGAVVFKINAPAGTKAINTSEFESSGNSGEDEVLLGRGGKMKITGVDRSGRVPVIHMDLVG